MDDPTGVVGFCQRVRPRLVGTLSLLCGDGDVAEELAQETLARVWLRWARVRELDEPLAVAWTYRVAINLGNSWLRRRVAERRARARLVAREAGARLDPDPADAWPSGRRWPPCPGGSGPRSSCATTPTCLWPRSRT